MGPAQAGWKPPGPAVHCWAEVSGIVDARGTLLVLNEIADGLGDLQQLRFAIALSRKLTSGKCRDGLVGGRQRSIRISKAEASAAARWCSGMVLPER